MGLIVGPSRRERKRGKAAVFFQFPKRDPFFKTHDHSPTLLLYSTPLPPTLSAEESNLCPFQKVSVSVRHHTYSRSYFGAFGQTER